MNEQLESKRQLDAAQKFFEAKIAKEKRTLKIRIIFGSVVTLLVLAYLIWISSTLTKLATPQKMREIIVTTVKAQAQPIVNSAKKELLTNKSSIIKFLTDEGLTNLAEVLFKEGEVSFKKLITGIANETVGELNGHFVAVLTDKSSTLRSVLENPKRPHLEADLIKAFDDDLQKAMGEVNLDQEFREPLSRKHKESIRHLNEINQKLQKLASGDNLNRQETLTIRFIKLWSGYVNDMGSEENTPKPTKQAGPPAAQ